jgi:hypothetical protein
VSNYQTPDDVIAYVKKLEQRVLALEKANPLNNGTIDIGGLTVKYPSGNINSVYGTTHVTGATDDNDSGFFVFADIADHTDLTNAMFASYTAESDGSRASFLGSPYEIDLLDAAGVYGKTVVLRSTGPTGTFLIDAMDNSDMFIRTFGGSLNIVSDQLALFSLPTTGSSANLRLDPSTAAVQFVTSSLRYKQDVEDAIVNVKDVLKLQGRTWRQKTDVEKDPKTEVRYIGFIAEELDKLPSLRQFVEYNEEGQPDAIQYDRITVALIELVKSQDKRIAALEAKNA